MTYNIFCAAYHRGPDLESEIAVFRVNPRDHLFEDPYLSKNRGDSPFRGLCSEFEIGRGRARDPDCAFRVRVPIFVDYYGLCCATGLA
jgi:hypothetical protein